MLSGVGSSFPGNFAGTNNQLCWGYVNQLGTLVMGNGIANVVKVSTGKYIVYWSRAFATQLYCVVAMTGTNGSGTLAINLAQTPNSAEIETDEVSVGLENTDFSIIAIGPT